MQKRFSGKKRKFSFFLYQTSNKVREKYVSVFTVLFFFSRTYQWVTSWYPEIMAFAIPFIPPKKVSFPEDPLLTKFFYDEVLNVEELGRVLFGSTCNARFKGDTVAIQEFIQYKWNEIGKKFLNEAKILESLNHPNVVNFKNVCYQPFAIMFEYYVSFSCALFGTIRENSGLDGFLRLLNYFSAKKRGSPFQR